MRRRGRAPRGLENLWSRKNGSSSSCRVAPSYGVCQKWKRIFDTLAPWRVGALRTFLPSSTVAMAPFRRCFRHHVEARTPAGRDFKRTVSRCCREVAEAIVLPVVGVLPNTVSRGTPRSVICGCFKCSVRHRQWQHTRPTCSADDFAAARLKRPNDDSSSGGTPETESN